MVAAPNPELLAVRVQEARIRLCGTRRALGGLPPGLEAEVRTDGTPRYTATVGRGRTRRRLRTDSLKEAVAWHRQRRAEIEARATVEVRVSVGKWRARWRIGAAEDRERLERETVRPLLEAQARRVDDLPPRVYGLLGRDGSVRYEASVEVGAHRAQRAFADLQAATAWQARERRENAEARAVTDTGHRGIRRVYLRGGGVRFKVSAEARGLSARETHASLDAAVAARDRLRRELGAAAESLHHPWRTRVRYRADGSRAYYARIVHGAIVLQHRCDSAAEAERWVAETSRALGLRAAPVEHLWTAPAPAARRGRKSLLATPLPRASASYTRLWGRTDESAA